MDQDSGLTVKSFTKISFLIFLLLTTTSLATCHFGVESEIGKIPAEIRAGMSNFDWIGINWIFYGTIIQIVAFVFLFIGTILFLKSKKRTKT